MIERADGTLYSNHQMPPNFEPNVLIKGNYISAMTLIRTADFPMFDENIGRLQDWDLWLTMLERGKIGIDCHKMIFTTPEREGITKGGLETYKEAEAKIRAKHDALCSTVFIKGGSKFRQTELFIAPHCDDETLFGAYTIMDRKPLVACFTNMNLTDNNPGRPAETASAMKMLGVDVVFITSLGEIDGDFDVVYAPMLEYGHPSHDLIHNMAKAKYSNVIYYSTYRSGSDLLPRGPVRVEATEEMKQKKLDALLCYHSQIKATRCHFVQANKDEYVDRKIINTAICCIAKDEDDYLSEWIDYHSKIGFEQFIIYDNESKIPITQTIQGRNNVLIIPIENAEKVQFAAYQHCLDNFKNNYNWIGFIDVDEYIVMHEARNINDALKEYEQPGIGGLGINWVMFGSSGYIEKPKIKTIEAYTRSVPKDNEINKHIKTIVRPRKAIGPFTPHAFEYVAGHHCVNEMHKPISGPFSTHSSTVFQINHYFTRSKKEWLLKIKRGRADGGKARTIEEFNKYDSLCTDTDMSISNINKRI